MMLMVRIYFIYIYLILINPLKLDALIALLKSHIEFMGLFKNTFLLFLFQKIRKPSHRSVKR